MKKKKTLIPNDFRDILSWVSAIGFLAIFTQFTLGWSFLTEYSNAIFLLLGGFGLLFIGKVFKIRQWLDDGIQENEASQLLSGIFGLISIVISILLFFNVELPSTILGFVGFIALFPLGFIVVDYIAKNTRKSKKRKMRR